MRPSNSRFSLSHRIVVGVAVGLAMTLALFGGIVLYTIRESAHAAYSERVALAGALGARVDDVLNYALLTLEREAEVLRLDPGRPLTAEQRRRLVDLRFRVGSFAIISVTDAMGTTTWTNPTEAGVVIGAPLHHPAVRMVLSTGESQITELAYPSDGGRVFACLAVPLRDSSGRLVGSLMAEVDPRHPALNLLPTGTVGEGILVQLMNENGRLLAGTEGFSVQAGLQHAELLAGQIAAREAGYRVHHPSASSKVASHVVAYAPLSRLPSWGVVVEQPQDLALATPLRIQQRLALSGLATLLLAVGAAWLAVRHVVKPLRQLTEAAERFAFGRLDEAVNVERSDELGTLGRAFEVMRRRLQRSLAEIEAHNRELEARVEARTSEIEERNRQLSATNAIATTVSSSLRTEEILARAAQRVLEVTGLRHSDFRWIGGRTGIDWPATEDARPTLVSGICHEECLCGRAVRGGNTVVVRDVAVEREAVVCREMGLKSVVAVPLRAQEQVLGVLHLGSPDERGFEQRDLDTLTAIGRQVGMALANARLYEEVQARELARQRLIEQIITAQEGERQRIARDLHDSTGQSLSAIIMRLESLESAGEASRDQLAQQSARTKELAERALRELRELVLDLRPAALDDLGLAPAIREDADRHLSERGIAVSFTASGMQDRMPDRLETCLFRVVQEAIFNIAKHAQARAAHIRLCRQDHTITATVADDGVGFDPAAHHGPNHCGEGLGLLGMRERVEMLGGSLRVDARPSKGTVITVVLPLPGDDGVRV